MDDPLIEWSTVPLMHDTSRFLKMIKASQEATKRHIEQTREHLKKMRLSAGIGDGKEH